MRRLFLFLTCLVFAAILRGENISGSVRIERKLTKRSVTAAVSIYQRGPSVELGKDAEEDPLAFERSRVVVWIEGPGAASHEYPAGQESAAMQQTARRFSPDVLVVPVGSVVAFPNMDPIFHNVFSLSRPQTFD